MASRDVNSLGRELLLIAARAGAKAVAKGAESILADAKAGVSIVDKRLGRAISKARNIGEMLEQASRFEDDEP